MLDKIRGAVQSFGQQAPGVLKTVVAGSGSGPVAAFGKTVTPPGSGSIINPSQSRLAGAGVGPAAVSAANKYGRIETQVTFSGGALGNASQTDWRVRVTVPPNSPVMSFAGVTAPLAQDRGVVFPHTPVLQLSHSAKYDVQSLVHTNYAHFNYTGSETAAITVQADFTVQSVNEALYLLAAIQFFRACTKMFYGSGEYVGNPPPVVQLSGYGKVLLPRTPCVVTSFSHSLPNDVDYMCDTPGPSSTLDTTWVPTYNSMSITLQPVVSRQKQAFFNHNLFAAGALLGSGDPAGGYL